MNLSETARLLTTMAAYDRRTIGDADVVGWQAVLSDAPFEDCMEAVQRHYAENTDWMMPAHVRRLVRDIHGERESAARATGWAPGQYKVPKAEAMPEIAGKVDESTISAPVRALLDSVRAMLPEGSREDLMPRREYWDREHRAFVRTRDAEPNPLYKPKADPVGTWGINCGHPGHPMTSHVCGAHGVPYPASYYDTQATAGTHDPKVDG